MFFMSYARRASFVFIVFASVFLLSGCGATKPKEVSYSVDLELWGIFDDSGAFGGKTFQQYREINPFVKDIRYRNFTIETYKQDLLDALSSVKPPDIFYIQSSWLPQFLDKIEPVNPETLSEAEFRENFVDVVENDAMVDGKIYGLPLSVDSLALYYNKDLFNYEAITAPPKTWDEFNDAASRLTKRDSSGIVQHGAAMGTAYNINRSVDIFQALLFQAGVQIGENGRIFLGTQGEQVMDYYTQFARGDSYVYTWNPRAHYSIDAFTEGNLGMMFNYSWHYETIKRKNAKMNFGVAPFPQPKEGTKANFANYWLLVVSKNKFDTESSDPQLKNKVRIHEAWQFLKYLTVNQNKQMTLRNGITNNAKTFSLSFDPAEEYLKKTGRPAARPDLIEKQKSDPVLAPFATGNLIAKSWRQPNPEEVEKIIAEAIDGVNNGKYRTVQEAVRTIESRIEVLYRKKD